MEVYNISFNLQNIIHSQKYHINYTGLEDGLIFGVAQYMLCCLQLFLNPKMLICTLYGGGRGVQTVHW